MVLVLFPLPPWKGWGINFHEDESHGQLKFSLQVISTPFYDIVFIFCIILLRELMPAKYRKCINFSFKSKCYIIHLVERKLIVILYVLEFSRFEHIGTGVSKFFEFIGSRLWKSKRLWQYWGAASCELTIS